MITTWVSLRYVWVLSSNTNFEETNWIQGVPPGPALPNAPHRPFQLRRRLRRWGRFFNWSNLRTPFAIIWPFRRQILPIGPTLEIITRNFPKISLINPTFRFWTMLIFFFRLFCSTSSSQRRGERRRSSICNRFYLRQQECVSQIWFYLRQLEVSHNSGRSSLLPYAKYSNFTKLTEYAKRTEFAKCAKYATFDFRQEEGDSQIWQVFLAATQLCLIVIFLAYFG